MLPPGHLHGSFSFYLCPLGIQNSSLTTISCCVTIYRSLRDIAKSVKAQDFDSCMRWFESNYPCHKRGHLTGVPFCGRDLDPTKHLLLQMLLVRKTATERRLQASSGRELLRAPRPRENRKA